MSDLIEREAAIAELFKAHGIGEAHRRILSIAPVDAVPVRRGSWTERKVLEDPEIYLLQSARCSVCGRYHTTPYMYNFDNFNFCPNCGAKMEDADEQTD